MKINVTDMDPWTTDVSNRSGIFNTVTGGGKEGEFEDNFTPVVNPRLPDSKEYLARLEEKLHKIKTDTNVLKQLSDRREACMQELLSDVLRINEDSDLDIPVENSAILRTLAPQKQALTQGELVELVKYDQLVNEDDRGDNQAQNEQV